MDHVCERPNNTSEFPMNDHIKQVAQDQLIHNLDLLSVQSSRTLPSSREHAVFTTTPDAPSSNTSPSTAWSEEASSEEASITGPLCSRYKPNSNTNTNSKSRSNSNSNSDSDSDSNPRPQDTLLEVKETADRGMAVFARRKIKAGTTVMAEQPLILLHKDEETDSAAIEREFGALSRSDQKRYLRLWDARKSRMSRVVSIYYSNCHNCDSFIKPKKEKKEKKGEDVAESHHHSITQPQTNGDVEGSETNGTIEATKTNGKGNVETTTTTGSGGSAVGAFSSRFNHSCIPNVQFSYDEPTREMRFRAIRDIPKGKEVCTNYDKTVFETKRQRRRKQQIYYGFVCACEACEPRTEFWAKSDERRKAMYDAYRTVLGCEKRLLAGTGTGTGVGTGAGTGASTGAVDGDGDGDGHTDKNTSTNTDQERRRRAVVVVIDEALTALSRLEGLLLKEGLLGVPLANTYRSMAKWAERRGDVAQAVKWKDRELEACLVMFGEDAVRTKEIGEKLGVLRNLVEEA